MEFRYLKDRIDELPLIICGPILRRVEKSNVSVWVAIIKQRPVKLKIYDSSYNEIGSTSTNEDINNRNRLLQIGEKLFVTNITIYDTQLKSGELYFYNLEFQNNNYEWEKMIDDNGSLTQGILVSEHYIMPEGITYADYKYPSFCLPSEDINNLKFFQGSCRKPHGGKTDALRGLDKILSDACLDLAVINDPNPANKSINILRRPQFACFTGDQIYADDVSDLLLFLLIDANESIVKINEELPGLSEDDKNNLDTRLKPGRRLPLIAPNPGKANEGKLSSQEGKSHLIKLGEFYAMYLFVWSDVLWPRFITAGFVDNLVEKELIPKAAPHPISSLEDERFKEVIKYSYKESIRIGRFFESLKKVRRALANIPSYMVFDDHEVTDDWFLTQKWTNFTLQDGTLSKRVIHNALASFTIFQAWGNYPKRFRPDLPIGESGNNILDQLMPIIIQRNLDNSIKYGLSFYLENGNTLLPYLENRKLTGGFDWSFRINFENFRLIFLNVRTRREFLDEVSPPSLIRYDELTKQLPENNGNKELTIVISPTPIIGNNFVEKQIQELGVANYVNALRPIGNTMVWIVSGVLFYYKYINKETWIQKVDKEAWIFDRPLMEEVLNRLSAFGKCLVLSGDVHYAFSSIIQYWNHRNRRDSRAVIGQLCSSSLKNSNGLTAVTSGLGVSLIEAITNPKDHLVCGYVLADNESFDVRNWDAPADNPVAPLQSSTIDKNTPVVEFFDRRSFSSDREADWEYIIKFLSNADRNQNSLPYLSDSVISEKKLAHSHRFDSKYQKEKVVVGNSNLGIVSFEWNDVNSNVIHELYFDPEEKLSNNLKPHTKHIFSLNPSDDERPSE